MTHHDDHEARNKLTSLIDGQRVAMLTTVTPDGRLHSRPMATQETEFDGDLWFFAEAGSEKIAHIEAYPHVNVSYAHGNFVSVGGVATVVDDVARKRELWNPVVEQWFQCEPDDPKVVLIRVDADEAEYWDSPSAPATVIALVKAKVTGTPPTDLGENETVELSER